MNNYTAVVKNEQDWWIGWIEEVPGVNCQERTREELMESLRVTLKEALEFNREEALTRPGRGTARNRSRYEALRAPCPHASARMRTAQGGASFLVASPVLDTRSAVPRHTEILDNLARKICKDLNIPFVK